MTPGDDVSRETSTPWQQYQDRSQAARAKYLVAVQAAYHEYLTGPYPDRGSYEAVERGAWFSYYAVCRDAWKTYASEIEITAAPVVSPGPLASEAAAKWAEKVGTTYPRPPAGSHPYRPNILSPEYHEPFPSRSDIAPYPRADHSVSGAGVPYPTPSFTPGAGTSICGFSPFSDQELFAVGRRCGLRSGHDGDHNDIPPMPLLPDHESER